MNLFMHSLLMFLFFFGTACAQQPEQKPVDTASDSLATTIIKVETAKCSMCVENITTALQETEGVTSASVDLKTKTATVQFIPAKIDLTRIEKAIANAGYDANKTRRNPEAYKKLDACCK